MKQKVGSILGAIVILLMVIYSPWGESPKSDFTEGLRGWGNGQAEISEKFTTSAVAGVEGSVVGEREIDGSNWAIPNIIRHWLGVD